MNSKKFLCFILTNRYYSIDAATVEAIYAQAAEFYGAYEKAFAKFNEKFAELD